MYRFFSRALIFLGLMQISLVSWGACQELACIVELHSPAVVNISSTQEVNPTVKKFSDGAHPLFRDFLKQFQNFSPQSDGSGIVITENGYIATNYHVVRSAEKIVVRLQSREELPAKLVGYDIRSDLALLKVEGENLHTIDWGSSASTRVGDSVFAIGSPFGFYHSVTKGIISAKGRSLSQNDKGYVQFIQTDVALNPGSSGGPLFTMDGKVIGINTMIYTQSGGFMGLSFAIPSDVAKVIIQQLMETGKVSRGWLGVMIQPVDKSLAKSFGLSEVAGAVIVEVVENSPAQKSGLRMGDVILRFDGVKINKPTDLTYLVGKLRSGNSVEIEIIRNERLKMMQVQLSALPESTIMDANVKGAEAKEQAFSKLGLYVKEDDEGVRVIAKAPWLSQSKVDITVGDIIYSIRHKKVNSMEQFMEFDEKTVSGESVLILVARQGMQKFVVIEIP